MEVLPRKMPASYKCSVMCKYAQVLDEHRADLAKVTEDLKQRLESVYSEAAVVIEDPLARRKFLFMLYHFYAERDIDGM